MRGKLLEMPLVYGAFFAHKKTGVRPVKTIFINELRFFTGRNLLFYQQSAI
jgi:hypothetical protein